MALSKIQGIEGQVTPNLGRRNLVINGAMQLAQRGTSFTGLQNTPQYATDRFEFRRIGTWASAQFAVTQESDGPAGFAKSLKLATTTAETDLSAIAGLSTILEGQDLQSLKWGTTSKEAMTLSFWVKSYQTGTYSFVLQATNVNRSIYGSLYTINQSNTWEKKTITIPAPVIASSNAITNDNQNGFEMVWHFAKRTDQGELTNNSWDETTNSNALRFYSVNGQTINGSTSTDNYIQITGVQLEVGDTATEFEHRPYGEELALCQRYYQKIGAVARVSFGAAVAHTTGAVFCPVRFMTTMRTTPSQSHSGSENFYVTGSNQNQSPPSGQTFGTEGININGVTVSVPGTFTVGHGYWFNCKADAVGYIAWDAEL